MLLLEPKKMPSSVRAEEPWRLATAKGLRVLFWSLWVLWLVRIYGFVTAAVLPLVTPKVKLPALANAASYAEPIALLVGLCAVWACWRVCAGHGPAMLADAPLRERFMEGLRRASPAVWGLWWVVAACLWAVDQAGFEVPELAHVVAGLLFAAAAAVLLGYLSRLSRALGQSAVAVIAAMMAVYVTIPADFETIGYGLAGSPDWKQWLPILSTGRFASWVVAFGGGLVVCGRLRRLLLAGDHSS